MKALLIMGALIMASSQSYAIDASLNTYVTKKDKSIGLSFRKNDFVIKSQYSKNDSFHLRNKLIEINYKPEFKNDEVLMIYGILDAQHITSISDHEISYGYGIGIESIIADNLFIIDSKYKVMSGDHYNFIYGDNHESSFSIKKNIYKDLTIGVKYQLKGNISQTGIEVEIKL